MKHCPKDVYKRQVSDCKVAFVIGADSGVFPLDPSTEGLLSDSERKVCLLYTSSGFADNVSKELPVEYAVDMNNLIRLEMKGSIG